MKYAFLMPLFVVLFCGHVVFALEEVHEENIIRIEGKPHHGYMFDLDFLSTQELGLVVTEYDLWAANADNANVKLYGIQYDHNGLLQEPSRYLEMDGMSRTMSPFMIRDDSMISIFWLGIRGNKSILHRASYDLSEKECSDYKYDLSDDIVTKVTPRKLGVNKYFVMYQAADPDDGFCTTGMGVVDGDQFRQNEIENIVTNVQEDDCGLPDYQMLGNKLYYTNGKAIYSSPFMEGVGGNFEELVGSKAVSGDKIECIAAQEDKDVMLMVTSKPIADETRKIFSIYKLADPGPVFITTFETLELPTIPKIIFTDDVIYICWMSYDLDSEQNLFHKYEFRKNETIGNFTKIGPSGTMSVVNYLYDVVVYNDLMWICYAETWNKNNDIAIRSIDLER